MQGAHAFISPGLLERSVAGLAAAFKKPLLASVALAFLALPVAGALASDAGHVRAGLAALDRGRWVDAKAHFARITDSVGPVLYEWLFLTHDGNTPAYGRLVSFVSKHPDWPGVRGMRTRIEKDFDAGDPAQAIEWFNRFPPLTARGMIVYLSALKARGDGAKAASVLAPFWYGTTMTGDEQQRLFRSAGAVLSARDHYHRLSFLTGAGQVSLARSLAQMMGKGAPALAEAQIALANGDGGVERLIAAVPASLQNDPGLLLRRLQWRRKKDLDSGAIDILRTKLPKGAVYDETAWGKEQMIIVRRLIERRDYKGAYRIAAMHPFTGGGAFAEAEWMAGWLSLRFLKEPYRAFEHFERMYQSVRTPLSVTRGAYWAGRAADSLKDPAIARKWFEVAAAYQTLFYGQLAAKRLGMSASDLELHPPPVPADVKAAFNRDPLICAARLLNAGGAGSQAGRFLDAYGATANDAPAFRLVVEEALSERANNQAVQLSKEAAKKGIYLSRLAYPTLPTALKQDFAESALVLGVIRQESAFDISAVSSAGALGLMQLMPPTAKHVAKKINVRHKTSDLTAVPAHNIQLGSAYLNELLDRFSGSYILAIAGYNAGPGRPARWVSELGDPRRLSGDALIDWIETIPIAETRNYVQRVSEGVLVYRSIVSSKGRDPLHMK